MTGGEQPLDATAQQPRRSAKADRRQATARSVASAMVALSRVFPPFVLIPIARGLASLAWAFYPRIKKIAMRNLELAYGDSLNIRERRRIAKQSAMNVAMTALEFIYFMHWTPERVKATVVETEGLDLVTRALAKNKGIIGVAMHYGNWELSGAYLTLSGVDVAAVGKRQRDDFFTNLAFPTRTKLGIENIPKGGQTSLILRALRQNKVLGLLADQNGGMDGAFVPFFGLPASTVRGPAALHLRLGAPMLLVIAKRIKPFRFRYVIREVKCDVAKNDPEAEEKVLAAMNAAYEQVIREDPTQWLWIHTRWRTRPPGDPPLY
jgi:Kdo2-lipid IVA lauroyltransferase/acyltransferase